jgi:hypothetical protein
MVSLLQEEMFTLPAFTVVFLLKTGRRLIQLVNNTQNGALIVFMLLITKTENSFYTMPKS